MATVGVRRARRPPAADVVGGAGTGFKSSGPTADFSATAAVRILPSPSLRDEP